MSTQYRGYQYSLSLSLTSPTLFNAYTQYTVESCQFQPLTNSNGESCVPMYTGGC